MQSLGISETERARAELQNKACALREQIASLNEQLADILTQCNALLPVCRAPDDILVALFSHIIASSKTCNADWNLAAVNISHVCRRWRAVAIGSPTLWADIRVGGRLQRANLFLSRTRGAQLSLSSIPHERRIVSDIQFMDHQMHRVRRLRLEVPHLSGTRGRSWSEHFASPATSLTHLEITSRDNAMMPDASDQKVKGTRIFGGETPALQSLTLIHLAFPSASPLFQNLTRLHLEGGHESLACRDLLGIMQRCPALEHLTLIQMTASFLNTDDVSAVTVELPRLSELHLKWTPHLVTRLLPQLVLPPTTTVYINISRFPWEEHSTPPRSIALPALSTVRHIRLRTGFWAGHVRPWAPTATYYNDAGHAVLYMDIKEMSKPNLASWLDYASTICNGKVTTTSTVSVPATFFDTRGGWNFQTAGVSGATELRVLMPSVDRHLVAEELVEIFAALSDHPALCPALGHLRCAVPDGDEDDAALLEAREALAASRPKLIVELVTEGAEDFSVGQWA